MGEGVGIAQWVAYLLTTQLARVQITASDIFPMLPVLIDCMHCLELVVSAKSVTTVD